MNAGPKSSGCDQAELVCICALEVLETSEEPRSLRTSLHARTAGTNSRVSGHMIGWFVAWPTDVLRPPRSLQARLAGRIAEDTGKSAVPPPERRWSEPCWEVVAFGIEVKLLATDVERNRTSMLVRLASGAKYPAHNDMRIEELYVLWGELWIEGRKLLPGDCYRTPGRGRQRVQSETGCTCVLMASN